MRLAIILLIIFSLTISSVFAVVELTWEDLADGAITLSDFGMPEDETWGIDHDNEDFIEGLEAPSDEFTKLADGSFYVEFTLPEFDDSKAVAPDYYQIMIPSIVNQRLVDSWPTPFFFDVYVNDGNKIFCNSACGHYHNIGHCKTVNPCGTVSHNALNWGGENRLELSKVRGELFGLSSKHDRVLPSAGIYGLSSVLEIIETSISPQVMKVGETTKIKVEVENTGVVEQRASLSLASAYGSCMRPQSEPINLKPGESKEIEFRLTALEEGTYPSIALLTWCDTSDCQDEMEVDNLIAVEYANQKPSSCDGYEVQKKEVSDKVTLRQQDFDTEAFTGLAKYSYGREDILNDINIYLDDIKPVFGVLKRIETMGA